MPRHSGGQGETDMKPFAVKGNVIYTKTKDAFTVAENAFVVSENGQVAGVFPVLPKAYSGIEVRDFGGRLVIPGLVDLHLHAPQYAFRGMGMDLELIPWLNKYAFPEEAKFADLSYAREKYAAFCRALENGATTRACVYATIHAPATTLLMELLEETGLHTYVGKVNMDRNSPGYLIETTGESSARTLEWALEAAARFERTKPVLTPRFVPSCTGELMARLGRMAQEHRLPVQSHLSENRSEIRWVGELHPDSDSYSGVYHRYGLFGQSPTIMAHCVYLSDAEMELAKQSGVYVAHCPQSNTNLASGIAPVRRMLDKGLRIGLGTDVAGGFSASMLRAISDTVQASKLYTALADTACAPVTLSEAFYMATKGGGSFFGSVGSFEPGYEMDAVVLDDSGLDGVDGLTVPQRLERAVYLASERRAVAKFVRGMPVQTEG